MMATDAPLPQLGAAPPRVLRGADGDRRLWASRPSAGCGDILLVEDPLLHVPENALGLVCGAPGAQAMLQAGAALGSFRSLGAYAAYAALSIEKRAEVDEFRADESPLLDKVRRSVDDLLSVQPGLIATADWPEVLRLHGILNTNALKLRDGALALYGRIGMASHSCTPNCDVVEAREACGDSWSGHPRAVLLRALVPLREGDELTISYLPTFVLNTPTRERLALLRTLRGFACRCRRCQVVTRRPLAGGMGKASKPSMSKSLIGKGKKKIAVQRGVCRRLKQCLWRGALSRGRVCSGPLGRIALPRLSEDEMVSAASESTGDSAAHRASAKVFNASGNSFV